MRRGKRRNYANAITQIANAFLHYLLQCMIYIHTIYMCVCVSVLDANVSRREEAATFDDVRRVRRGKVEECE